MISLRRLTPSFLLLSAACATAPDVAQKPVKTPVTPAAPVYVLDDFLGTGASALDGLLGEPALTRREGEGEYRRYALTTCTLIVILYPDELGVQKVTQVDATATTSNAEKPDLNECLAAGQRISSEVDAGSRKENAIISEARAVLA